MLQVENELTETEKNKKKEAKSVLLAREKGREKGSS